MADQSGRPVWLLPRTLAYYQRDMVKQNKCCVRIIKHTLCSVFDYDTYGMGSAFDPLTHPQYYTIHVLSLSLVAQCVLGNMHSAFTMMPEVIAVKFHSEFHEVCFMCDINIHPQITMGNTCGGTWPCTCNTFHFSVLAACPRLFSSVVP